MTGVKRVTSIHNPTIKKYLTLREKARDRKKLGLFVLEGKRELELALKKGYSIETLFYCPDIITNSETLSLIKIRSERPEILEISLEVYKKLVVRKTTEGVIAIVESKEHSLKTLVVQNKTPLILVAEAPEKPGNIGALLRTADAAKLDAVLIADYAGDLYNPNIIRSSVGCVFTVPIGIGSSKEILHFLKDRNIPLFAAALTASTHYDKVDFSLGGAIAVGTEATGLTHEFLMASQQNIIIPMEGEIDSMNVSVSAAIIIFEAKRQRGLISIK